MVDDSHIIPEPPIEPDDTRPTGVYPRVDLDADPSYVEPPNWRQIVGLVSLLGAAFFTIATIIVLLLPVDDDPVVVAQATESPPATTLPTAVVPTNTPVEIVPVDTDDSELSLLDPALAETILQQPLVIEDTREPGTVYREGFKPFTIIPDRPRNEIIQYTAESGDTVSDIAERFGLQPETLAWSNSRRIVRVIHPGDVINIPPVDGVYITAVGSTKTIAYYANLYKVDDPYVILDSPFNDLAGYTPDKIPDSGTRIFIPGGEGEELVWGSVEIVEAGNTTSGGNTAQVATVTFQQGDPGSCAPQAIVQSGSFWSKPVTSGYTVTQGFSSFHTGIDLAGAEGTPIHAANAGRVIFAGWNSWGYGYTIVLIHGPTMTVYGHLSQVNVSCGQDVSSGQVIGAMGNTGNSSGTHLHFEIRSRQGGGYVPGNPTATMGF